MRELYSHNHSPCITKLEFFHPCFQGLFEADSQQAPHYLLSKHHWLTASLAGKMAESLCSDLKDL